MEKIVPLTGALVVGPLGVAHLPRLWLKCSLQAAGLLPDGYFYTHLGANQTLVDMLGLDPDATYAYLATIASYPEFETWVKANAKHLDPASIAAINAALAAQLKPVEKSDAVRAMVGFDDELENNSALLNALDDWHTVWTDVTSRNGEGIEPIVPALSSQSAGPLGLRHLPRLWLKAILESTGALYAGWRSGKPSGFDTWFAGAVGVDIDEMKTYLNDTKPTYMQFEAWFAERAKNLSPAAIAKLNAAMLVREKPPEVAARERAELGIEGRDDYRLSVEMNDLMDWKTLHEQMVHSHKP